MKLYKGLLGAIARAGDAVVDVFAPRIALRRRGARAKTAAALAFFEGATSSRTRRRWSSSSADAEILADLGPVRDNARGIVRDNVYAAAAVRVIEDNVVGSGIKVQACAKAERTGLTDKQVAEWNRQCEEVFETWAEDWADATDQETFWDLQRRALRLAIVEGESFAHRVLVNGVPGRKLSTAVEFIDPDRVQNPKRLRDPSKFRDGVEIGARGQPVRYYVTPQHPGDRLSQSSKNEPVALARFRNGFANVVHVFRRDRPGQSRGISAFAPAIAQFDHAHHYTESEMIAARANAQVAMFVNRPVTEQDPDIYPVQETVGDDATSSATTNVYHENLDAGTIEYLNEGETIQGFIPNRPNSGYGEFIVRILRGIAASLDISYELLAKDFGGMNYSSARVALLESRRGFEALQQSLVIGQFSRPWYRNVIQEAVLRGILKRPKGWNTNQEAFLETRWVPPSWGWVDPVKEITAAALAIEKNLSTPQQEASRNGFDAEEVILSRARHIRSAIDAEEMFDLPKGSISGVAVAAPSTGGTESNAQGEADEDDAGGDPSSNDDDDSDDDNGDDE